MCKQTRIHSELENVQLEENHKGCFDCFDVNEATLMNAEAEW